ncbi:HDAC4_5 [Lepeophtheirus salmonis]|uniref:histone deacetylase n=1 Tax=Lepeophtheirus salmonis TaxID=72036 RepID=A0A7R8D2N9_LEPSM|nr:HDAC4_5 [Lepeophtheirus salmonis]CAF3004839.1 HDAC4_5 [Lepeophtheirus salmonis]
MAESANYFCEIISHVYHLVKPLIVYDKKGKGGFREMVLKISYGAVGEEGHLSKMSTYLQSIGFTKVKAMDICMQAFTDSFGRNFELLQQSQENQLSQYIQQVELPRHRSNSTTSSPTNNATINASLGAGSPRDIDQKERHRLRFIKQKSLNDQSAVASPEVKKHLQEFVLQKKRKEASMVNLKSEILCSNASQSSSSTHHPILRKTASESNLLKMKSKRADIRSSVTPYARFGSHGPTQPVIPEGSVVHDSAPSSPQTTEDSTIGGSPSSCSYSMSPHVPSNVVTTSTTPPTTSHHSHHSRYENSLRSTLVERNNLIIVGNEDSSINSKSLPNIPSAIGRAALINKAVGRRSPPTNMSNRLPHHPSMMVRRTKSSAILPLRKHLIEKQRSADEEQYFQQKLNERRIHSLATSVRSSGISQLLLGDLNPPSTGLGFDSIMLNHTCKCGNNAAHIENPSRASHIWNRLIEQGLVAHCKRISRKATLEEIQSSHSENHTLLYGSDMISRKSTTSYGPKFSMLEFLRTAVGTLIEISEMVVNDELKNGFAIIRPPGHHAEYEEAMGFCYFNSVAITANRLLLSPNVTKVMILDWAIHHGNGTQKAFYDNPNVLYISLHRHDNGNFYPGTGSLTECGHGPGLGFNVNIAWTGDLIPPMGDSEYLAAFRNIVMPIAREFNPDVVLVSAGFDAAIGHNHPIGGYHVSTACFAYMTLQLQQIAGASEQCVRALLKFPIEKISEAELARRPTAIAVETLQKTLAIQALYWNSLKGGCETAFLSHLEAWEKEREEADALSAMATLSMQQHRNSTSILAEHNHLHQSSSHQPSSTPITISYY